MMTTDDADVLTRAEIPKMIILNEKGKPGEVTLTCDGRTLSLTLPFTGINPEMVHILKWHGIRHREAALQVKNAVSSVTAVFFVQNSVKVRGRKMRQTTFAHIAILEDGSLGVVGHDNVFTHMRPDAPDMTRFIQVRVGNAATGLQKPQGMEELRKAAAAARETSWHVDSAEADDADVIVSDALLEFEAERLDASASSATAASAASAAPPQPPVVVEAADAGLQSQQTLAEFADDAGAAICAEFPNESYLESFDSLDADLSESLEGDHGSVAKRARLG